MEGKRLGTSHSISFSQPSLKPQVELRTEAAILPDSKNLIVPFRAVSLHAVDLSVIRIYESNVLMFMQSNSLASSKLSLLSFAKAYSKEILLFVFSI
mgnify:CR=1 FL=1